jgi:hypothetical protein
MRDVRVSQSRAAFAIGRWFSPSRWPPNDKIMALAAVVLAVTPFTPWFKAAVKTRNPEVTGFLIDPPGSVSGIGAHQYLWGVLALALLQFGLIATRYAQPRRVVRLPGHRWLLVAVSGLSLIAVAVGCAVKPAPWYGNLVLGDGLWIDIEWDTGALVALGAAIVSLGVAIAAIRDHARQT